MQPSVSASGNSDGSDPTDPDPDIGSGCIATLGFSLRPGPLVKAEVLIVLRGDYTREVEASFTLPHTTAAPEFSRRGEGSPYGSPSGQWDLSDHGLGSCWTKARGWGLKWAFCGPSSTTPFHP